MRTALLSLFLVIWAGQALAFQADMPNLVVPSTFQAGEAVFGIEHRFLGPMDEEPFHSLLGMDEGANVGIGVGYALRSNLQVVASRTRFGEEYALGAGYTFSVPSPLLTGQIAVQFFTFDRPPLTERRRNFLYLLALQAHPVVHRITPVLNIGYDGYNERFGYGAGIQVSFEADLGVVSGLDIVVEYYPVLNRRQRITGPKDAFVLGLQLRTYGHLFGFVVGNSSAIGIRRLMLGAQSNDVYFGFNIKRQI